MGIHRGVGSPYYMMNHKKYFNNKIDKKNTSKVNMSEVKSAAAKSMLDNSKKDKEEKPKDDEQNVDPVSPAASYVTNPNSLFFFRKYYTFQALLEVTPQDNLSAKDCFSKVILYIMSWFRKRLSDETFEKYPDIAYLPFRKSVPDVISAFHKR